jgi:exosome complex exonuclease RRP6
MMDVLRSDPVDAAAKANLPPVTAKSTTPTLVAVVDDSELVSGQSSFWGGAFGSSVWDTPTFSKKDDGLRLAVPLPQLSSEIFSTFNGLPDRSVENIKAQPEPIEPDVPVQEEVDEPFVLKRGAERKGDTISEPEATTGSNDTSPNDTEDQAALEKAARRAEKKAAKRLRQKQRQQAEEEARVADAEEEDEEEPFDYSKADSVLHGKRKSQEQGGPKRKKPFDPYAKVADAPKGMRRVQTERAGKSHTFKS